MIILLTGKPGVGKSTIIERFIARNTVQSTWVVTVGMPRPQGDRGGFMAINSAGVRRVISHKTDIASNVVVGENHVDIAAVDAMFADVLSGAIHSDKSLTIVDEIGPIQLLSPAFVSALEAVFAGRADVIATIHYKDERLKAYRSSARAALLEVTVENRDMLPAVLVLLAEQRGVIHNLSKIQQAALYNLLQYYVAHTQELQINKLLRNALPYVAENRVQPEGGGWRVAGRHGSYYVRHEGGEYSCECDLFNGTGSYAGQAGICSHIQAVCISFSR